MRHNIFTWVKDISIRNKFFFIVGIMIVLMTVELIILWFAMDILSATRAYVGGEGLWSKAQKNAVVSLLRYNDTHNEIDYQQFLEHMNIPLGDKKARLELEKPNPNFSIAYQGFQEGRNQNADINGLIKLFRNSRHFYYIDKVISIWAEGDADITILMDVAKNLHTKIYTNSTTTAESTVELEKIHKINNDLTLLENNFSYTLGEASRWLKDLIFKILFIIIVTVEVITILLTMMIITGIRREIAEINRVAKKISNLDFTDRATCFSNDEMGQLALYFNQMIDDLDTSLTQHKATEKQLKESELRFRQAFDYASIGMALVSLEGKWLKVNSSVCKITGYSEDELLKINFQKITYKDDLETDFNSIKSLLKGEIISYEIEKRCIRKDKSIIWIMLNISLIRDISTNAPLYFITQMQNINIQKQVENELKYLAYHDNLTSAKNRRALEDDFEKIISAAKENNNKVAVCYIDLDLLKDINDTFGHLIGDETLKMVAMRLNKYLDTNDLLARIGGDEFVLILAHVSDENQALLKLNTLQTHIAEPLIIDEYTIKVNVSIGVSIYPKDGNDLDVLLKHADQSLYVAKKAGRNQIKFY